MSSIPVKSLHGGHVADYRVEIGNVAIDFDGPVESVRKFRIIAEYTTLLIESWPDGDIVVVLEDGSCLFKAKKGA